MERLTERTADGILVKENYEKETLKTLYQCYGEKPNSYYSNCEEGYCAMEKLADYEDLEEHGRLVKLPCKVGTKVYAINRIIDYGEVGDEVTYSYSIIEREFQIYMIIDYGKLVFGKTVFLTKSEAEAKLKELRGGENESSN